MEFDKKTVMIMIALVTAMLILLNSRKSRVEEGFYNDYGYYKQYCSNCSYRSRRSCSKCLNCGYAINSAGYGQCVPGDSHGPYFDSADTHYWEYGDENYYYPHHAGVYPVVKVKAIHPSIRYQKTWKPWRYKSLYLPRTTI